MGPQDTEAARQISAGRLPAKRDDWKDYKPEIGHLITVITGIATIEVGHAIVTSVSEDASVCHVLFITGKPQVPQAYYRSDHRQCYIHTPTIADTKRPSTASRFAQPA